MLVVVMETMYCSVQEPLLCNDREMGGYTMANSGEQFDKHVPATIDTKATMEELCVLCGP
jgi:hypothetical protein